MIFGAALIALQDGIKVARRGWNGKGIFLELQKPDAHSKMTQPYIFIDTTGLDTSNTDAPKCRVPWAPSQTDMLADDWEMVGDISEIVPKIMESKKKRAAEINNEMNNFMKKIFG